MTKKLLTGMLSPNRNTNKQNGPATQLPKIRDRVLNLMRSFVVNYPGCLRPGRKPQRHIFSCCCLRCIALLLRFTCYIAFGLREANMFFVVFFSIGSTQKVSLVRATAKASLVATLSESLPLSSSVNGQKLIISAHIGMKKARSDNYQCCHDNISAVTISVLSRS